MVGSSTKTSSSREQLSIDASIAGVGVVMVSPANTVSWSALGARRDKFATLDVLRRSKPAAPRYPSQLELGWTCPLCLGLPVIALVDMVDWNRRVFRSLEA